MKKITFLSLALVLSVFAVNYDALASSRLLMREEINQLPALAASAIDATNDRIIVWDNSLAQASQTPAAGLTSISGITAGTVTASKAVVVDANKDISSFRNLTAVNLKAGSSGAVGTVTIFPTTASKGSAIYSISDQTGNTTVTHNDAAMGQATVVTTPDPGSATANVVLSEGTATINGAKTLSNAIITGGTVNNAIIGGSTPAAATVTTLVANSTSNLTGVTTLGAIPQFKVTNAITAFSGGGQGSAVALTSTINRVTTVAAAHDSVKLPTSIAGQVIKVINAGANALDVFPASGDLIGTLAANTAVTIPSGRESVFDTAVAGTWNEKLPGPITAQYATGTTTTTFAAGQLTGASYVVYNNTQGTPGSIATRTAAQMFTDDPQARVGGSYILRIKNGQGTGTLTVTAGSNVTLTGTATIAINTWRDFLVTYTTAAALVMQQIGTGTDS